MRLHLRRAACIVGLLVVGACSQDVSDTSSVLSNPPASQTAGSQTAPGASPETTTTTLLPPLRVSLDQTPGHADASPGETRRELHHTGQELLALGPGEHIAREQGTEPVEGVHLTRCHLHHLTLQLQR